MVVCNTTLPLPPLSALEIDKALQKERMARWMRITLANLRTQHKASGMGEIERPTEV